MMPDVIGASQRLQVVESVVHGDVVPMVNHHAVGERTVGSLPDEPRTLDPRGVLGAGAAVGGLHERAPLAGLVGADAHGTDLSVVMRPMSLREGVGRHVPGSDEALVPGLAAFWGAGSVAVARRPLVTGHPPSAPRGVTSARAVLASALGTGDREGLAAFVACVRHAETIGTRPGASTAGGGTTLRAALAEGRRAVGAEMDPETWRKARGVALDVDDRGQQDMFGGVQR
jgi:hypothetical protein